MDKRIVRIFVAIIMGMLTIVGCTIDLGAVPPTGEVILRTETTDLHLLPDTLSSTPTIVVETAGRPGLSSTLPTPTLTPTATQLPSATPTVLPTLAIEETVAMVCQEPPQEFKLPELSNLLLLADLRFESEELITFEGWINRPEPSVLPRTPEPTPEFFPIPDSSYPVLLIGGQLNLSSDKLSQRPLDVDAPLTNPCGEECPLEVLGQSPNREWQLVQINDWLRAQMGLWLVSAESAVRLVSYVPAVSTWQWAEDSSALWLVYSYHEDGGETLVIRLENPPAVHKSGHGSLLDPAAYWSGYSPIDNTAYVVPAPYMGHENTELLFTIDLDDDPKAANGVWSMPGIASVAWNEATRSMTAQIMTEDGIVFRELPGGLSLTIPNETLTLISPSLTRAMDNLPNGISSSGDWAFSPSGEKLALLSNPRVIWVFDCVPAP